MIVYKDRAWCLWSVMPADNKPKCGNQCCYRNLTDAEGEKADFLRLPVSIADFRRPDCGYRRKKDAQPID